MSAEESIERSSTIELHAIHCAKLVPIRRDSGEYAHSYSISPTQPNHITFRTDNEGTNDFIVVSYRDDTQLKQVQLCVLKRELLTLRRFLDISLFILFFFFPSHLLSRLRVEHDVENSLIEAPSCVVRTAACQGGFFVCKFRILKCKLTDWT